VVAQGTQFGLGAAFLRYTREYERQADLLGAQMMARAGYDPREMANMFQTIQKQGGSGGPEWLQSHPNPSNRQTAIQNEAKALRVSNPVGDTRDFEEIRARLKQMPRAPTTEQAIRDSERGNRRGTTGRVGDAPTGRVEPPSTRYTRYNEGDIFTVSVPSNWQELQDSDSVTFAPRGGYGTYDGQNVFTHGVQIGIARNETHDLQTSTEELIDDFSRGNPDMRRETRAQRTSVDGRQALVTTLSNRNEATGDDEVIQLVTTQLGNGDLLYAIGVAPRNLFASYRGVFNRIVGSIRMLD
jgi:hypothetical protein